MLPICRIDFYPAGIPEESCLNHQHADLRIENLHLWNHSQKDLWIKSYYDHSREFGTRFVNSLTMIIQRNLAPDLLTYFDHK